MDTVQIKRTLIEKTKDCVMITGEEAVGKEPAFSVENMPVADTILDEKNYRAAVEALMRLRSDKAIGNSVPSHAAILFEAFFKNAKNRVCIFCKNLNNGVFGINGVVEAAALALQRQNVGIDIILQDEYPEPGAFADFLKKHSNNPRLRLRRVEKESARSAVINFSVMDKQALRFEKDRNEVKAFAIMCAPNLAEKLIIGFEEMFAQSVPLKGLVCDPAALI